MSRAPIGACSLSSPILPIAMCGHAFRSHTQTGSFASAPPTLSPVRQTSCPGPPANSKSGEREKKKKGPRGFAKWACYYPATQNIRFLPL